LKLWAFTPATFSALLGNPKPNYLKLMMKRLADQGVLIRAARGVYVNPHARSMSMYEADFSASYVPAKSRT